MAPRRVLIVDDEAEVRKTLPEILPAMRYSATRAARADPRGRAAPVGIVISATQENKMSCEALRSIRVASRRSAR
jgi:CheY-like chemotaxis protein